jgi:drug/metabolite transporter (DMT)-like permease
MSRLRKGEWLALAGAVALVVLLFLPWFDGRIGWTSLGWLMIALLVLCIAGAVWIALTTVDDVLTRIMPALVVTLAVSALSLLILVLRVLAFPPGDTEVGAYLGILATLAIFAGAGVALADERTDAPESAYTPPAPRPAPPAT